jgi:hypothetical protein
VAAVDSPAATRGRSRRRSRGGSLRPCRPSGRSRCPWPTSRPPRNCGIATRREERCPCSLLLSCHVCFRPISNRAQPIFLALLQTKGHPTPPQILLLHHPRHVRHQEKPRAQPEPAMLCLRARVAAQLPCPSPSSAPATPLARFARLSTVSLAVAPPASAPPPASKRASPPSFLSGARWGPPMRPSFSVGKSRPTTRGERSGESVSVTSFTEGFTHCRVLFHTHTHTGLEECCFLVS